MRLMITGATGFVGRNLLLTALRDERIAEVIAYVRAPEKLKAQLEAEGLDFAANRLRVIQWGEPVGPCDALVHSAGLLFARDRDAYFRMNADETERLMRRVPAGVRIIAVSSQSAGGATPIGKLFRSFDDADAPLTWYGESKLEMERRVLVAQPEALILRPPMILGPRDRATLPLFRMAASPVRVKPGLQPKTYSWIAAVDLARAVLAALAADWSGLAGRVFYVCGREAVTDIELIRATVRLHGGQGVTVGLPHGVLWLASNIADRFAALRNAVPSLTRDRVREIFPNRWVIDGAPFEEAVGWMAAAGLEETLRATGEWYRKEGTLA
jgi:nucleoside-diphosphate-sugar epimerase